MIDNLKACPTASLSLSKKGFIVSQGVSKAPSDEGAVAVKATEGEITKRYNNTPIIDSSRIICIITHCIESGVFFVLFCCVISPLAP